MKSLVRLIEIEFATFIRSTTTGSTKVPNNV